MWNPAMLAGLAVSQVALSRYETLTAALRDRTPNCLKIKEILIRVKEISGVRVYVPCISQQ